MYPVQPVISYLNAIFTTMMHVHREVTAKQHTGGGGYSWSYKYPHIKKQTQEWVRFVSYRYTAGQYRYMLSFLACLLLLLSVIICCIRLYVCRGMTGA